MGLRVDALLIRPRKLVRSHSLSDSIVLWHEVGMYSAGLGPAPALLGSSRLMLDVRDQLERLADVPWPVRIEGPTGSGKGIAARALHAWSSRASRPFIDQSLTMMVPGLEFGGLMGWTKGAYTGATGDSPGAFESAHGGTLFLDEIAAASFQVQGALLQLLEDGAVRRIGERRSRRLDVRVVFATNADLEATVRDGRFRLDLYHRLGSLVVRMPALQERVEDIPEIVADALNRYAQEARAPAPILSGDQLERLLSYSWPGNVRELHNALKHLIIFGRLPDHIKPDTARADWRDRLANTIARHEGNKSAVARELGISRKTLYGELARREMC